MKAKSIVVALFLIQCSLPVSSFCQLHEAKTPESVGFSSERLKYINLLLEGHIAKGEIPGAVTYIARYGKIVHFEAFGKMDIEQSKPMVQDAIFRVASMGKLVTSIAVMILYEEGRFFMADPIAKYIPEFKTMKVATFDKTNGSILTIHPAQNPITIHDLLRHTSGFVYPGKYAGMDSLFKHVNLDIRGGESGTFIKELASLPLVCEPGTQWEYGYSLDVLGCFVEVLTGEKFIDFCHERIFKPLGLNRTDYVITEKYLDQLTTLYQYDNGRLKPIDKPENSSYRNSPKGNPGGGWLLSSAPEFALICQLFLNGGEVNGTRILGKKTIDLMLANHMAGIPKEKWYRPYAGFGIGGAVLTDVGMSGEYGSPGVFWWLGSNNTYFFIDPAEELVGIIMMPVSTHRHLGIMEKFGNLCYQSIIGK